MFKQIASRIILGCFSLFFTVMPGWQTFAWSDTDLIDRVRQSEKSIVTVETELTRSMHTYPPRVETFYRTAAGLIIDPSGIILTNTHTVIHAPTIFVILADGTKLPARLLFASKNYDFSFLKVYPRHALKRVRWADSSRVSVGDPVITVGHSNDHNKAIMIGHVKNIIQGPAGTRRGFLELDLDLHHGDSGSPILDGHGRLLGIIMARRESPQGSNSSIAIASNKIRLQYLQYRKNMP
jgi:S1-C subfamily serine protease